MWKSGYHFVNGKMTSTESLVRFRQTAAALGRMAGHIDDKILALSLVLLGEFEERPFDMSSLAAALGRPRPSVHRLIERVINAGEVRAIADPKDRRRVLLTLTALGQKAVSAYLSDIERVFVGMNEAALEQSGFFTTLLREEKIEIAQVRDPLLQRLYDWALSKPDSIPIDYLDAIYTMIPNLNDMKKSRFSHWGVDMRSGRPGSEAYRTMAEFIRPDSFDYYRMVVQHFMNSMDRPTIHQVEVGWDGPGTTYQRILLPHPRLGVIGCSRWLD